MPWRSITGTSWSLWGSRGMLGVIFRKSQNKIQDPAKLKRLVELINEETWTGSGHRCEGGDLRGSAAEECRGHQEWCRAVLHPASPHQSHGRVLEAGTSTTICDPACGTGGFFLAAHDFISSKHQLDKDQKKFLKMQTFKGWEIVDSAARLCAMNLYLHGIGGDESPVGCGRLPGIRSR